MEENNKNINIVKNMENNKYRIDNRKFDNTELEECWKKEFINGRIVSKIYIETKERMKMELRDFSNKI